MNIALIKLHSCAYMHVCSIFFFNLFNLHYFILESSETKRISCAYHLTSHEFDSFFLFPCARIDNNRREYFVSRAAQLCVHACVLRFFLLFFSNKRSLMLPTHCKRCQSLSKLMSFAVVAFFFGRARIDNNRREYCVH